MMLGDMDEFLRSFMNNEERHFLEGPPDNPKLLALAILKQKRALLSEKIPRLEWNISFKEKATGKAFRVIVKLEAL